MTRADVDLVAANESLAYAFPWSRRAFAGCLASGYECWIASRRAVAVGHGVLSIAADEAQLLNVCVVPSAQGSGYGRALAMHLVGQAARAGAANVYLEVRMSNRVAMTLYDSLGFREVGRRAGYYPARYGREDAMVMALDLASGET